MEPISTNPVVLTPELLKRYAENVDAMLKMPRVSSQATIYCSPEWARVLRGMKHT